MNDDDGSCVICYEILEDDVKITPCGHVFHGHCILKWLEQTPSCPLCKASIRRKKVFALKINPKLIVHQFLRQLAQNGDPASLHLRRSIMSNQEAKSIASEKEELRVDITKLYQDIQGATSKLAIVRSKIDKEQGNQESIKDRVSKLRKMRDDIKQVFKAKITNLDQTFTNYKVIEKRHLAFQYLVAMNTQLLSGRGGFDASLPALPNKDSKTIGFILKAQTTWLKQAVMAQQEQIDKIQMEHARSVSQIEKQLTLLKNDKERLMVHYVHLQAKVKDLKWELERGRQANKLKEAEINQRIKKRSRLNHSFPNPEALLPHADPLLSNRQKRLPNTIKRRAKIHRQQ